MPSLTSIFGYIKRKKKATRDLLPNKFHTPSIIKQWPHELNRRVEISINDEAELAPQHLTETTFSTQLQTLQYRQNLNK
jgi:hypothetical protein